jgi:hypothetical protein
MSPNENFEFFRGPKKSHTLPEFRSFFADFLALATAMKTGLTWN